MPTADWRESVKQRLLNLSAVRSETFNVLLMRYGVERLLYRMMRSPHADAFVLKGAMLFAIWADKPHRPTQDLDLLEINEAFAAQACAVTRDLGLDPAKVNPNGSGISLGHPIGATGALITVKALYELERIGGRYALVTMCIGGGQGIAAIFERTA
mgnify:CR=1 FL=1